MASNEHTIPFAFMSCARNSISLDMKVYALQLNRIPPGVFHRILRNFGTVSFGNFGISSEKKTEKEKGAR